MKIKFFISDNQNGKYPWASSEMVSNDIDLLELLLASDLSSSIKVKEFESTVFLKKETWWFNATKVEVDGEIVKIYPAFDADCVGELDIQILRKIISDWKNFLCDKIETVKTY